MIESPSQKINRKEKKLITNSSLEEVAIDIETKLNNLGIDKNKFSVPFEQIIKKLFRFLSEYEIKYEDFASPDRLLRGLCLVDMWINTASSKQKGRLQKLKSTIDRFKLICISGEHSTKFVQLSEKVIRDSTNGSIRASQFNPNLIVTDGKQNLIMNAIDDIKNNHIDNERSLFFNNNLLKIFPKLETLLQSSAQYQKTGQLPFEIKILDLGNNELMNYTVGEYKLGWKAFLDVDFKTGTKTMYLTFDSMSLEHEGEHELIHTLSRLGGQGIQEGIHLIFGKAMNEAITENLTSNKQSYPYPRYILDLILKGKSELEALAYNVYFGNEDRDKLTASLFNLYGAEGVMKFDFMTSMPIDKNDKYSKSILFDWEECLEFFSRGVEDPHLEALQKTKILEKKFEEIDEAHTSVDAEKNKTREENRAWRKTFGKSLLNISFTLKEIFDINNELPFRDLLNEPSLLDDYNKFLQDLDKYDYIENEANKEELQDLDNRTKNWVELIKERVYIHWNKNNQKPLFEKEPSFSSGSIISSKALEIAWLTAELMQGRSIR